MHSGLALRKNALNHDNKNNHNFQFTKFSFISTTEIIFQVNSHIGRWQPREMLLLKPLNTYILVFLFEYWFSFPSRKVLTSLYVGYTDFSVLAAVISENSHKLPWIENGEGFAVHSSNLTEWRERRVTCQLLIGDNKYTWKNMVFFTCFVTEFLGAGNPFITP